MTNANEHSIIRSIRESLTGRGFYLFENYERLTSEFTRGAVDAKVLRSEDENNATRYFQSIIDFIACRSDSIIYDQIEGLYENNKVDIFISENGGYKSLVDLNRLYLKYINIGNYSKLHSSRSISVIQRDIFLDKNYTIKEKDGGRFFEFVNEKYDQSTYSLVFSPTLKKGASQIILNIFLNVRGVNEVIDLANIFPAIKKYRMMIPSDIRHLNLDTLTVVQSKVTFQLEVAEHILGFLIKELNATRQ